MKFEWNEWLPYKKQYIYQTALNYLKDNIEVSIRKDSHFIVIPNVELLDKIFKECEETKNYITEIYIDYGG